MNNRMAEWISVMGGVVAGIASGFLSAVASPFSVRRAEEAKERTDGRRALVAQGRALVAEARRELWDPREVYQDIRFIELRSHLPVHVQAGYAVEPRTVYISAADDGGPSHDGLANALDDLERKWRLV